MPDTPAERRYRDAVAQAVREAKGQSAQIDFLRARCRNDNGILWFLFSNYFDDRVRRDIEAAADKVRSKTRSKQVVPEETLAATGTHGGRYPSAREPRVTPQNLSDVVDLTVRSMKLWQFRVNGKPLALTSVYEVEGNLKTRERDASFLRKVLEGLPKKSEQPISYFYAGREGAEEVERFYIQSEAERRNDR